MNTSSKRFESIPAELRELRQWLVWRTEERTDKDGKTELTKVPYDATTRSHARSNSRDTWAAFGTAVETFAQDGFDGIGFVFSDSDPYVGVDLDDCRDPAAGDIQPWALTIVEQLDSYTEVSPSGTGLHTIQRGALPPGGRRRGSIEMYDEGRYFCMTGRVVGERGTIEDRQSEIEALHTATFPPEPPRPPRPPRPAQATADRLPDDALLEKARGARNGDRFSKLFDAGETCGHDSHSEADLALCSHLAFWTDGDAHRIDRLFRRSALYRDKWDQRRFADGRTYGQATVEKAVKSMTEGYAGDAAPSDAPAAGELDRSDESEKVPPERSESTSMAKRLVEVAEASGVELFHDQREDPCAAIRDSEGRRRIVRIESREFSLWLRRLLWKGMKIAPSGETVATARHTLASIACFDSPKHDLHVRCAWKDGAIWIDLDGHWAVRVVAGSWTLETNPPILFRRFSHQRPLPIPVSGGKVWDVLRFLRVRDKETAILLLCYLIAALVPDIPIATLLINGPQGATKTTTLKIVKRLLDPSAVAVRGGVRDLDEFAQAASQNRVLMFDNLSTMPDWLSDAISRAVTAEGWTKRTLYTDEDATVFEYRGVVGIGGINIVAERADLLDRALIITLARVPDRSRKAEKRFWAEFEEARPRIFGAMLDTLASAMANEPTLELRELPRMADFARWGAAAACAMGGTTESFLTVYSKNVGRQNETAVESSPVAQCIVALMRTRTAWSGSPSELLAAIQSQAEPLKINTKDRLWPKAPNWVTRRLREVEPNLLALGIETMEVRTDEGRTLTLARRGTDDSPTDGNARASDEADIDTVIRNLFRHNVPDGNDGNDSISVSFTEDESLQEVTEPWEERAAILEFDGGLPRPMAERLARGDLAEMT